MAICSTWGCALHKAPMRGDTRRTNHILLLAKHPWILQFVPSRNSAVLNVYKSPICWHCPWCDILVLVKQKTTIQETCLYLDITMVVVTLMLNFPIKDIMRLFSNMFMHNHSKTFIFDFTFDFFIVILIKDGTLKILAISLRKYKLYW